MSTTLSNPTVKTGLSASVAAGRLTGAVSHVPADQAPSVGTNAGNVNLIVTRDFTVSTGAPLALDLSSVADPAGNTVAFGHVTHWLVENLSTTAGEDFTLGGGTNALIPTRSGADVVQANGGRDLMCNPNPGIVVDGTHKVLQVAVAAGTGVAGRVTILGRTT